jgi:hypothetical protein
MWAVVGLAVVGGIVVFVLPAVSDDDGDDDPGRMMTLTEAACQMLDDGDDPELVYAVAKDLAADHPADVRGGRVDRRASGGGPGPSAGCR